MDYLAMHIPDGFVDIPVSLAAFVLSALIIAYAARLARVELDDRVAPLAGLTAVFLFAGQMLNFPVAAGTSGHLLGGALAAVLVGPWVGMLVVTVVLVVQALMFADGGLTALGLNVLNMGIVATLTGWVIFRALVTVLPQRRPSAVWAAALGALVSVPAAALAFCVEFALGGTAPVSMAAVVAAMTGVHVLIGIGEAVITGLVVSAVLSTRPDIVVGVRDRDWVRPPLKREEVPV